MCSRSIRFNPNFNPDPCSGSTCLQPKQHKTHSALIPITTTISLIRYHLNGIHYWEINVFYAPKPRTVQWTTKREIVGELDRLLPSLNIDWLGCSLTLPKFNSLLATIDSLTAFTKTNVELINIRSSLRLGPNCNSI